MCDNSAVRWSEYEAHKTVLHSEYKSKIYVELQKLIDTQYTLGVSQDFIQGIEYARDFIQNEFFKDNRDRTTNQNDYLF
jgi:hypothetical protein